MREFTTARLRRIAAVPRLVYRKVNKVAVHLLGPIVWKPSKHRLRLERLGTGDGEWILPVDCLDGSSICYCVGVGNNASLDFGLVKQFHCSVFSFDPTPAAAAYMEQAEYDRSKLRFLPVGIWDEDTSLRLYMPANNEVILSVFDLKGTGRYFVCECQKLSTIMRSLGHTRIDLLKLDIEGAWQQVVRNIVEENISVSMMCVEFDSPTSLVKVSRAIRMLRQLGLELVYFEKDNYLFVQKHMLN